MQAGDEQSFFNTEEEYPNYLWNLKHRISFQYYSTSELTTSALGMDL